MTTADTFTRPATPPERELWLAAQLAPDPTAFTTAHAFPFEGGVDAAALARAWDLLVERVPLLTARFENRDGAVEVVTRPSRGTRLVVTEVPSAEAATKKRDAVRQIVFDPARGPLSHAELIRDAETGTDTVAIAVSHLAVDGYAWSILCASFNRRTPPFATENR